MRQRALCTGAMMRGANGTWRLTVKTATDYFAATMMTRAEAGRTMLNTIAHHAQREQWLDEMTAAEELEEMEQWMDEKGKAEKRS